MDKHLSNLMNMCRVCTSRVHKSREIKAKKKKIYAATHMDHIHILYGIDVSCDNPIKHPPFICSECHKRILNSLSTGVKGPNENELNLDGIYAKQKQRMEGKDIWCEHLDDCVVCDLYANQSKPGPVEKATAGRPKEMKDELLFDVDDHVFSKYFSSTSGVPTAASIRFVEDCDNDHFICPICRDVLPEQSVCTGCHYFCDSCLSTYYSKNRDNVLPCPVCYIPIHVHSVSPITEHFIMILNKVQMQCEICGVSGRLGGMREHKCTSLPVRQNAERSDDDLEDNQTMTSAEIAIQTTPKSYQSPLNSSLQRSITSPLQKAEEKIYTHMTRRKLHEDPGFLTCHTGGQSIHFVKIVKARKSSTAGSSPLKKKRARQIAKARLLIAGCDSSNTQQASELKILSSSSREKVCKRAGVRKSGHFSCQTLLAMKAALGLTTNQMRAQKRYLKNTGMKYASEKEEKVETDSLFTDDLVVSKSIDLWHKDETKSFSIKGMVRKPTPCAYVTDLQAFVKTLLDEYQNAGKLVWDHFPANEVWIKIGGDHGGGSFKVCLQIANLKHPNSKENTIVCGLFEAKDYYTNLASIAALFRDGISKLKKMTWNGKQVHVFVFGDYAFLCDLYGLSGAAGKFPCLWCSSSKNDIQKPASSRSQSSPRTLKSIKEHFAQYRVHGRKKQLASDYMNAIHEPLWPVSIARVCPPYLHILLGVVKKHHDLLEEECHDIDLQLAKEQADMDSTDPEVNLSLFDEYVKVMRRVRQIREDNAKKRVEYRFEKKSNELSSTEKEALLKALKKIIKDQEATVNTLLEQATLKKTSGPVTSHLDTVLQENSIKLQAFHSRSFTGNHCHKYLNESTINNISGSVVSKTSSLTNSPNIIQHAKETADKFKVLNSKFSGVHAAVSHSRFVSDADLDDVQEKIDEYLSQYRTHYPNKIFPKLHMLEDHIVPWITATGFGMGLMGEQGGESAHKKFNELKRCYGGIQNPVKRLGSMMKNHMLATHPRVTKNIIHPKRRKLTQQQRE